MFRKFHLPGKQQQTQIITHSIGQTQWCFAVGIGLINIRTSFNKQIDNFTFA